MSKKKIVNIELENLHIFWATSWISMEVSGKMWLVINLKVTKNLWKIKYILTRACIYLTENKISLT